MCHVLDTSLTYPLIQTRLGSHMDLPEREGSLYNIFGCVVYNTVVLINVSSTIFCVCMHIKFIFTVLKYS